MATTRCATSGCILANFGVQNERPLSCSADFFGKRCLAAGDDDTVLIDPSVPFWGGRWLAVWCIDLTIVHLFILASRLIERLPQEEMTRRKWNKATITGIFGPADVKIFVSGGQCVRSILEQVGDGNNILPGGAAKRRSRQWVGRKRDGAMQSVAEIACYCVAGWVSGDDCSIRFLFLLSHFLCYYAESLVRFMAMSIDPVCPSARATFLNAFGEIFCWLTDLLWCRCDNSRAGLAVGCRCPRRTRWPRYWPRVATRGAPVRLYREPVRRPRHQRRHMLISSLIW